MNDRGPPTPNGEAPAGGFPRAQGKKAGNGTHLRTFLGDITGGVACGACGVTFQLECRAVRFPCGQGRHVRHARCLVEVLARGTGSGPLRCLAIDCGALYPRRDALEAAVQADPGLRNQAARVGGGPIGDEDLLSQGRWYG